MNAFQKSWLLTKQTFSLIAKERSLVNYSLLAGFLSFLFYLVLGVLGYSTKLIQVSIESNSISTGGIIIGFIAYVGTIFLGTYFAVATSKVVLDTLESKPTSFSAGIALANQRLAAITTFTLLSAIVGLILKTIENLARNQEGIFGKIVSWLLYILVGAAWSISTYFAIPVIVSENVGSKDAIKKSLSLFNSTWGEQAIVGIGFGLVFFLLFGASVLPFLALLALNVSSAVVTVGFVITAMVWVVLALLLSVAQSVFQTVLYFYAQTKQVPAGFSQELIANAVTVKQ